MASKMLEIDLWVGRQFMLEIFCSNVYGMQMMIEQRSLNQWNELKTLKRVKKSLNVQNRFMSNGHACSHSTLGYLWMQ